MFVGRWGDRLSQRNVQLLVVYWAKRQGLALHVHLHMFRHSCAMHVLERCQDIRAVQELLGNASISTTAIYTHLDFEHLMTVYRKAVSVCLRPHGQGAKNGQMMRHHR